MDNDAVIAKIKKLHQEGDARRLVVTLSDLKNIPEELYPMITDAIVKAVPTSPACYTTALMLISTGRLNIPMECPEGEMILSTLLDALSTVDQYDFRFGEMGFDYWVNIDDSRVLPTLVKLYKTTRSDIKRREVVHTLGKMGREEALPVLLDNYLARTGCPSDEEVYLHKKYPLFENGAPVIMDTGDRDRFATLLLRYLEETQAYEDPFREDVAYTLAVLYASGNTSSDSKRKIQAKKNQRICSVHDKYIANPIGYKHLKDYVNFGRSWFGR